MAEMMVKRVSKKKNTHGQDDYGKRRKREEREREKTGLLK